MIVEKQYTIAPAKDSNLSCCRLDGRTKLRRAVVWVNKECPYLIEEERKIPNHIFDIGGIIVDILYRSCMLVKVKGEMSSRKLKRTCEILERRLGGKLEEV